MDYRTREITNDYLNEVSKRIASVGHWANEAMGMTKKCELEKVTTIEDITSLKKDLFLKLSEGSKLYSDVMRERNSLISDRGKVVDEDLEGFIIEMMKFGDKARTVCEEIDDARERLMDRMIEMMEEAKERENQIALERDELEGISKKLRGKLREYESHLP